MTPRVLVTGGNGFIGRHLVRALIGRGFAVRVFDLPGTAPGDGDPPGVEQFPGNILDEAALAIAMTGVAAVYHLAAKVSDWGRPSDFLRLNVDGTRGVVQAMTRAGARHLVQMSSLAIHGWRSHVDATEDEPADVPASYPYGVTKRIAERVVQGAHARGEIVSTIVRPGFFPFGPGDRTSFLHLARHLARGHVALIDGGRALTCVSYAPNLAAGMASACLNEAAYGETFVIADDGKIAWRDLLARIATHLGVRPPTRSVPGKMAYAAAWTMDRLWLAAGAGAPPPLTRYRINLNRHDFHFVADKAKAALGYAPAVGLEEGLARTARWYAEATRDPKVKVAKP
jgi:nucleoside-diphosphate-sugar epimerase